MKSKIINFSALKKSKESVLTFGHFTSIHPGHIRYLMHAKDQGQRLIVAIVGDAPIGEKRKFQFNQIERAESLAMLGLADVIVLLENNQTLSDVINKLHPKLLVLGKEFENSSDPDVMLAIKLLKEDGRRTLFHAGEIKYASTDLLIGTQQDLADKKKRSFQASCSKQELNLSILLKSMKAWEETSLIVIGDAIVDQYSACEAIGMSAEAPVVVVKELKTRNFIGGAAIVASHIKALGARCDFISVVGNDETSQLVREKLSIEKIGTHLITDSSRPTTFKKRYIVENQKLFRVSRLEDHSLSDEIESKVISSLEKLAPDTKGIVISDFVYGVITERILEKIYQLAKKYKLMLFGDIQCSSQIGLVTKFKNFSLLCPNEREARLALQDKESGIELISQKLLADTNCSRLIMKLGADGFIAYDRLESGDIISQSFPALSVNPVDVAGAGDSLLAVMATGLTSNQSIMTTAALGCCMTALTVEQMGNTPVKSEFLRENLVKILT